MIVIKKKPGACVFLFFIFFLMYPKDSFGQQDDLALDHIELVLNGELTYLSIYPNNKINVPISEDSKTEILDQLSVKWNNKYFNPYRGENVVFPFQLVFVDTVFSSPVTRKMVVTSRYGWRRGRPHQGIDIDLVVGDTVKSILDGKVRYVGYHGGHGKTVVIRHHNGLETVYAHLSNYFVKENDEVKKGQGIAKGGLTGNTRGSHLHLEVRYHGKSINPEYLFEFDEDSKIRSDALFVTRKWATPRYHRSTRKSNIVVHKTIPEADKFEEQQKKIYTVRKGDTLYRIANKYGLAVSEICKINSIRHNSVLKIGQQIFIN